MGTMLSKENKSLTKAKIIMGVVTALLFLVFGTTLIDLYPAYWYQQSAQIAHVIGTGLFILSLLPLFTEKWLSIKLQAEWAFYLVWFILILAGMLTCAGFKFDLPR